jgi:hypothetical protein
MSVSQNWVSGVSVERKKKTKEGRKEEQKEAEKWGLEEGWVGLGCDCDDDRERERERERRGDGAIARQWLLAR